MSQIIIPQLSHQSQIIIQRVPSICTRQRSPQNEKQAIIKKIKLLLEHNSQLEIKRESFQNTIYDLRKLVELTRKQGLQATQHVRKQVKQLQKKKERGQAALKYQDKEGNHLQKCMLYWEQFL